MALPRRTRRAAKLTAAGLAGLALTTAVGIDPAAAYVPAEDLTQSVYDMHQYLIQNQNRIWQRYYTHADNPDGDGIPGPDGTPDGTGAFMWFTGDAGRGAIYAESTGPSIAPGATWGTIAQSWANRGYETTSGYPRYMPHTAAQDDIDDGCRKGEVAQRFETEYNNPPVYHNKRWIACLGGGQVRWYKLNDIVS